MKQKLLEVKNLTKIYKMYSKNFDRLKEIFVKKSYHKEFIANNNISFDLYAGETLGIIGINGAGKSTLLKQIAGIIEPTHGTIIKKGKVVALLELGTGFNDELSGYENIFLNGTLLGMNHAYIKAEADKIIAFSELANYIQEPIRTYSSGMRMRLAFSIAIFANPDILIVDEALSVGDAHFSAKCTKALQEKKSQNKAIIYVSHDMNSLKLLCERVILLNKGELIKDADPESVINTYNFLIAKLNDNAMPLQRKIDNSYGNFNAQITAVQILKDDLAQNVLTTGEDITIKIAIKAKTDLHNMTIGMIIRDKYGQDIYGTNTFHHNIKVSFKANENYTCSFTMPLEIGVGKYTITAAVHTQDTHLENCSHWLDNGCSFEVVSQRQNSFIGLVQLHPSIKVEKCSNNS